jgi:hypothetical protein
MPESGKYGVLDCKKHQQSSVVRKYARGNRIQHTKFAADTTGSYYEGLYVG